MDVKRLCKENYNYIINMRRHFHQNPELSGEECQTSEEIKRQLMKMHIPYSELVGSYGVVGTIVCGRPGKTIGILSDIDALPINEQTGCDFASRNPGVMHACGHDAHTAMLLGAAKILSEMKENLSGTVQLLFQPAEELGLGTQEIDDYLKANGGLNHLVGMHVIPTIDSGEIALIPGTVFGGACDFEITITGKGGHAGVPELSNDPVKAACDLVLQLTSIPSNYYSAIERSAISVCVIQSGNKTNIIPDTAVLRGGIRYFSPTGLNRLLELIEQKIAGVEMIHQVKINFSREPEETAMPPVYNDPNAILYAKEIVSEMDDLKVSDTTTPLPLSDNISKLLEHYPGFFALLGTGNQEKGCVWPLHNGKFSLDEDILAKGSEFFVRYTLAYLNENR